MNNTQDLPKATKKKASTPDKLSEPINDPAFEIYRFYQEKEISSLRKSYFNIVPQITEMLKKTISPTILGLLNVTITQMGPNYTPEDYLMTYKLILQIYDKMCMGNEKNREVALLKQLMKLTYINGPISEFVIPFRKTVDDLIIIGFFTTDPPGLKRQVTYFIDAIQETGYKNYLADYARDTTKSLPISLDSIIKNMNEYYETRREITNMSSKTAPLNTEATVFQPSINNYGTNSGSLSRNKPNTYSQTFKPYSGSYTNSDNKVDNNENNSVVERKRKTRYNPVRDKLCEVHGWCNHLTAYCREVMELKNNINNKRNQDQNPTDQDPSKKPKGVWMFCTINAFKSKHKSLSSHNPSANCLIMDCAAYANITFREDILKDIKNDKLELMSVNQTPFTSTKSGQLFPFGTVHIVPEVNTTIISLACISKSYHIEFDNTNELIAVYSKDRRHKIEFTLDPTDNLYKHDLDEDGNIISTEVTQSTAIQSINLINPAKEWTQEEYDIATLINGLHEGSGHACDEILIQTCKNGCINGLQDIKPSYFHLKNQILGKCLYCMEAHMPDITVSDPDKGDYKNPGRSVQADVAFMDYDDARMFPYLITTDMYSKFTLATKLESQSEDDISKALHELVIFYEHYGHTITTILHDNSKSILSCYNNGKFPKGLALILSSPGKHCHTVENSIGTIKPRTRSVLFGIPYKPPLGIIHHAINHVVFMMNNLCKTGKTKSPFEVFTNSKPKYSKIYQIPFGSIIEARINNSNNSNDTKKRANLCIYLGPTMFNYKSGKYVECDLEQNRFMIKETEDFTVVDYMLAIQMFGPNPNNASGKLYYRAIATAAQINKMNFGQSTPSYFGQNNSYYLPITTEVQSTITNVNRNTPTTTPTIIDTTAAISSFPAKLPNNNENKHWKRNTKRRLLPTSTPPPPPTPPITPPPITNDSNTIIAGEKPSSHNYSTRSKSIGNGYNYINHYSIKKALSINKEAADAGIDKELLNMINNKVIEPVHPTEYIRKNSIRSFMFLRKKWDDDVEIMKGRLCADGSSLAKAAFPNEYYSPCVDFKTITTTLAMTNDPKYERKVYDVKEAFTRALIGDREVFMTIEPEVTKRLVNKQQAPSHWKDYPEKGVLYVQLKKALYGLPESSLLWYNTVNRVLERNGFTRCQEDYCLYKKEDSTGDILICIHIDDFLITSSSKSLTESTKTALEAEFGKLKEKSGDDLLYLGFRIIKKKNCIVLDQTHYWDKLIEEYKAYSLKEYQTPCDPSILTDIKDSPPGTPEEVSMYRSLVAKIMYGAKLRPDILYSISVLATKSSNPLKCHWESLLRLLGYIKRTAKFNMTFLPLSNHTIRMYSDASHGSHSDAKGHTGYLVFLGDDQACLCARSVKQRIVTASSYDAELVAIDDGTKAVEKIYNTMKFINPSSSPKIILYTDSLPAITTIAKLQPCGERTKSINHRIEFIKQTVADYKMCMTHCHTEEMIADVLTKSLPTHAFKEFGRAMLNFLD